MLNHQNSVEKRPTIGLMVVDSISFSALAGQNAASSSTTISTIPRTWTESRDTIVLTLGSLRLSR